MMEHYIIVKFTEGTDVKALVEPVRAIFNHGKGSASRICFFRAAHPLEERVRRQDREEGDF